MNEGKRRRLQKRGWRFGTAQELLGLSDEEAAFVELKLELAEALRSRRKKHRLSQLQLARLLGSSQSRVAKMEAGDPSVSMDLLVRALLALGASRRELGRVFSTKAA
jgi:predicted transcriptional regulator